MSFGASVLIIVIKTLLAAKKLATIFFIYGLFLPGRFLSRIIFYRGIVRFYCRYISLCRKFGLSRRQEGRYYVFFQQKLVHLFVLFISVSLIFINLTSNTKAGGMTDKVQNTILHDLLRSGDPMYQEDEQFVIETFDQEIFISPTQQKYLENLSAARFQPRVNMNEEESANDELPTTQSGTAIVRADMAETRVAKRPREAAIEYVVLPGDTVSTIAEEHEISVSTILWENDLSAYSIIRPGDKLVILPQSGITHKVAKGENLGVIAKKYDVEESAVLEANKIATAATLSIGQEVFIPGGRKINYPVYTAKPTTGLGAIKEVISAPSAKPAAGNKMNWPTEGSRISQYYSWRHTAVDIANKTGTPIYASDAGTIEVAGWGTGYGNQILIDHGGGKKTRYAHLSKFSVSTGDKVGKGDVIGLMGSTGYSTGPHLHFEVIINNTKYNPLTYIR